MHFDWTFLVRVSVLALPAMLLMALHGTVAQASAPSAPLEKLSSRRIFFGHQSVGGNILDGVKALPNSAQGVVPRVVEVQTPTESLAPGTLAHAMVGQNEKPESKIADFERLMDAGLGKSTDVAFFKFCYIDINGATDTRALFEKYRVAMEGLKARHPSTTFVHVTAPLTTVQRGAKAWLKEMLGRPVWGVAENVQRETFNELMRKTYAGKEPLFDLARLESTAPDGSRETYELNGQTWPAMVPGYSDDGGHLNAAAQARLATELLNFLASLPAPVVQPPIPAVQATP
ncbi:hypothetical protein ACN47A_09520 [Myxococcus fulvus]|uniref:hypothetical protein n=1 Tax=Myxococcus fulvus TaxID=33 RepID=UPI003B9C6351